MAQSPLGKVFK